MRATVALNGLNSHILLHSYSFLFFISPTKHTLITNMVNKRFESSHSFEVYNYGDAPNVQNKLK